MWLKIMISICMMLLNLMLKNSCFIDTGAYFARFYKRDQHHHDALERWDTLKNNQSILVTTNHVLDELATLLGRRMDNAFATKKMKQIYASDIWIERTDSGDEKKALKLFEKYGDQQISFTDALSFVVMKNLKIKQAFTFDRHFKLAGFTIM